MITAAATFRRAVVLQRLLGSLASLLPLTATLPFVSQAQEARATSNALPNGAQVLSPVVVSATRNERLELDVPASVSVIDANTIRDQELRVNLSESLVRVPGLTVLNRQNYAQDLQISIRGFGARSTFGVRGVRLYVDGVPASFPDGQGQVSHFPLNLAERIEVLRGPFSALYGNSSGGVISLTTQLKPQEPRFELSGAAGSNHTWRSSFSAQGGMEPYAFALDATRFQTDGERAHSSAQRDTLTLRTAFLDSPLGQVKLSLNSMAMPDAQDPLGLTRTQFQTDPEQASPAALQFNTRKTTRQNTAGAQIQSALATGATLTTALWVGQRRVTQFQAIPVATQTAPNHPGGVIDFDRGFGGADVRATLERGSWTTHLGVAAERMDENRRGYNNFTGSAADLQLGVTGAPRRAEDNRVTSIDPYVQAEWRISERWLFNGGVRHSQINVRSQDHFVAGSNGDDSGSTSFSGVTPTAGLVFKPSAQTRLYVSAARGFETPTLNELAYRSDGSAGLNTNLRAARSNNYELGAKAQLDQTLYLTAAVFSIQTSDDIVVSTNAGGRSAFSNVARTRRQGLELSADWHLSPRWQLQLAASALQARFDDAFLTCGAPPCSAPSLLVADDNHLPGVPEKTLFAELLHKNSWADLSLRWRAQSAIYVDDRNTDRAAGYGTWSLGAARSFQVRGSQPRVFARVDNVFDQRYAGSVIVNEANGRYFEPALGRTYLLGLDWRL